MLGTAAADITLGISIVGEAVVFQNATVQITEEIAVLVLAAVADPLITKVAVGISVGGIAGMYNALTA